VEADVGERVVEPQALGIRRQVGSRPEVWTIRTEESGRRENRSRHSDRWHVAGELFHSASDRSADWKARRHAAGLNREAGEYVCIRIRSGRQAGLRSSAVECAAWWRDLLGPAREAIARRGWSTAPAHYDAASKVGQVWLDDVERYAISAHLVGNDTESRDALTRAEP
jgi:hypothetical protein